MDSRGYPGKECIGSTEECSVHAAESTGVRVYVHVKKNTQGGYVGRAILRTVHTK
jgi:hypothetical protein